MKTFTDKNGKDWLITIDVEAVHQCREQLDVDVVGLVDDGMAGLGKLLVDPVTFTNVVYVICKEEAEKQNLDLRAFRKSLGGPSLLQASDAFVEALIDFFPDPRQRAGLTKVIEKARKLSSLAMEQADAKIDAVDVESEARKLIDSFGGSPESSESTPDLLRFGSST